jgi:hypothetical protein
MVCDLLPLYTADVLRTTSYRGLKSLLWSTASQFVSGRGARKTQSHVHVRHSGIVI